MGRLTDLNTHTLIRSGRYGDGNTLYPSVSRTGSKSWVQRIGIRGRRHDLGLGSFPKVCVAEARERGRHITEQQVVTHAEGELIAAVAGSHCAFLLQRST